MRLDRFITLRLVRPCRQALDLVRPAVGQSVSILMYHGISGNPEPRTPAYYRTNTSPAQFRHQMRFLREKGYESVALDQALQTFTSATVPPSAPSVDRVQPFRHRQRGIVITFDDGFRSFYTEAFPVLQEFGFTATMFLPTAFIGGVRQLFSPRGGTRRPAEGPQDSGGGAGSECLTWAEVLEMRSHGIRFGSHTVTHPRLSGCAWEEIERELGDSRSELEQRLGEPITTFAYPYALPQHDVRFLKLFRELLVSVGYRCCVTTEIGRVKHGDDPYRLKRLPVNSADDPALFLAKLSGDYDWMKHPQSLTKKIRGRVASCGGTKGDSSAGAIALDSLSDHSRFPVSVDRARD